MRKLLFIELQKTLPNNAFRVLLILYTALLVLTIAAGSRLALFPIFRVHENFQFPDVWNTLTWVASWYNLLLTITIIILTGNEYTFRTYRQQIIAGLNVNELLIGKVIIITLIAFFSLILVGILSLASGFFFSNIITPDLVLDKIHYLFIYLIQIYAYLSMGLFIATLLRNQALSIVLFLFYPLFELFFRWLLPDSIDQYLPFAVISNLTPMPQIFRLPPNIGLTGIDNTDPIFTPEYYRHLIGACVYIGLFISSTWLLMKKRSF